MKIDNINLILENESLKNEFIIRNLDLSQVFSSTPENPESENKRLHSLLDWVNKYTICQSRKKMEADGYDFPPIEPDYSPDNDWFIFERWMKGQPVQLKLKDQISEPLAVKNPQEMNERELEAEIGRLENLLSNLNVCMDLRDEIPPKLVYKELLDILDEEFTLVTDGSFHIDGCSGYCPGCFQRPWCETGGELCWPEDEKIGEMFLPDCVRKYVSPSPTSLAVLKKHQAKEYKEMQNFDESFDGDDEVLPF